MPLFSLLTFITPLLPLLIIDAIDDTPLLILFSLIIFHYAIDIAIVRCHYAMPLLPLALTPLFSLRCHAFIIDAISLSPFADIDIIDSFRLILPLIIMIFSFSIFSLLTLFH
jgi:hypothetical protein